jgi:DNA-binding MarR family transcriptional regulator
MRQIKELYGLIITSTLRKGIMNTLNKKSPLLQSAIAQKLKRKQQDISKEVYKLQKEGLIECLNPEKGSYKAYTITKIGREALNYKLE